MVKRIFNFEKSFGKKFWNKVPLQARWVLVLGLFVGALHFTPVRIGLANTKIEERKQMFIREHVRDPNATEFKHFDEEEPPQPLTPRTSLDQFRADFARMRRTFEGKNE